MTANTETSSPAPVVQAGRARVGYWAASFLAAALVLLVWIMFGHAPFAVWFVMGCLLALAAGALTGIADARRWGTALVAFAAEGQVAWPSAAFGQLYGVLQAQSPRNPSYVLPGAALVTVVGGLLRLSPPGAGLTTLGLGLLTTGLWLALFAVARHTADREGRAACVRESLWLYARGRASQSSGGPARD